MAWKNSAFPALPALFALLLSVIATPCSAGMVSLTFDDGLRSVYDEARPVLLKYNKKATVAIIVNRMLSKNNDYMDMAQVLELQKDGWEVASHGMTHTRPTSIPRFYYEEPVTDWSREDESSPVHQTKYGYDEVAGLLDNERPLTRLDTAQAVEKMPGSYYLDQLISELHVHPFVDPSSRDLNIRSVCYQREMQESKQKLESLGFNVSTFVTPFNYWTTELQEVSKFYYKQVASGMDRSNFPKDLNLFWLKRYHIRTATTTEDVKKLIERDAVDKNGWVILCLHGIEDDMGWQSWDADRLEDLVSWLDEQGIKVVTLSEGASLITSDNYAAITKIKR
ncbi:MAG: polysaccharide deacetylase family protein [Syntrophobacteraceae bacterium]